jgi:hypothetical protein
MTIGLEHFTRRSRQVRLGGRSLGIGRFRFHVGGGWYLVTALSVLRICQLEQVKGRAAAIFGQGKSMVDLATLAPMQFVRLFAPLFIAEDIEPRHLNRASLQQIVALSQAVEKVNDLACIEKTLTPKPGGGSGSSFEEWTVLAAQVLGRHLEDVLHLPFEQVARHLEVLGRLQEESKPVGERTSRELSEDEVAELNRKLDAFGVEVVPDA